MGRPTYIADEDVERFFATADLDPWFALVVRRLAAGTVEVPPRTAAGSKPDGSVTHVMTARDNGNDTLLVKVVDYDPRRPRREGRPSSDGILCVLRDGVPLLEIPAARFTSLRTAALTAAVVDRLAPPHELGVAVIGMGPVGRGVVDVLQRSRDIRWVRVLASTAESTAAAAASLGDCVPLSILPAADVGSAVADADLVVTATSSVEPFLSASHLRPGVVVAAVGSGVAGRRELDGSAISRMDRIIVESVGAAWDEAGDLIRARDEGVEITDLTPLEDLFAGAVPPTPNEIVLYKSVGSAWQDLACVYGLMSDSGLAVGAMGNDR